MARFLLLSTLIVVLGSALGDVDVKRQTNSDIERVNVNIDNVVEDEEYFKIFYKKCLARNPLKNAELEETYADSFDFILSSVAASLNYQVDVYNYALKKSDGEMINLTPTEFQGIQWGYKQAVDELSALHSSAKTSKQLKEVAQHCYDVYQNIVLMKSRGGLTGGFPV